MTNAETNGLLHKKRERLVNIVVSLLFGVFVFLATYYEWLAYPEQLTQDLIYKSEEPLNNSIKIIGIDDASIRELGNYNDWSRQIYADLVNLLCAEEGKPAVIGFDVLFFSERDAQGDSAFTEACEATGNVVLASQLNLEYQSEGLEKVEDVDRLYWSGDILVPFSELETVTQNGFVNIILDSDGFVRHTLLEVLTKEGSCQSLAYQISKLYSESMGVAFPAPKTDETGSVLIDYVAEPGSYECISLVDVLSGRVPASVFEDCIVLVGSYAEGMMDSYQVTSDRNSKMYGVEINANIIQGILTGKQLVRPTLWVVAFLNGLISALLLYLTNRMKLRTLSMVLPGVLVVHVLLCLGFYRQGIVCYVVYLIVALLLIYIINVIWKYMQERIAKERELKMLLYSMAEAMTEAIDQRTPYNASHTRKVSEYSVELAEYVNLQHKKKRTSMHLSTNEVNQLKLAALLHDVGKLTIPLSVLDKPTRLGKRKADIWQRLEKIELLYQLDLAAKRKDEALVEDQLREIIQIRSFLERLEEKDFLKDEEREQVQKLAAKKYVYENGDELSYLNEDELECLLIKKGTLTEGEMQQVHDHALHTDRILSHIRFGHNYDKVRAVAASHHELLNGKGYPRQLKAEEIDILTRILTICDVYDALTADDRPYKKAKTREESFRILGFMAKDGEIDGELLEFARELWCPEERKES